MAPTCAYCGRGTGKRPRNGLSYCGSACREAHVRKDIPTDLPEAITALLEEFRSMPATAATYRALSVAHKRALDKTGENK